MTPTSLFILCQTEVLRKSPSLQYDCLVVLEYPSYDIHVFNHDTFRSSSLIVTLLVLTEVSFLL